MKKFAQILSLVIVVVMLGGMLAACAKKLPDAPTINTPLVVAYNNFSQKFSPFFSETAYDADVAGMTQIGLMTTDRLGQIIMNGIKGEKRSYNNTEYEYKGTADLTVNFDEATNRTTYTAEIRKDLVFSDGVPVTADDIIFTYYTYLDPSYVGSSSLKSYKIVGLQEYLTQTPTAVLDRYTQYTVDIFEAGPDHVWSESDGWSKEIQDAYWAEVTKFGVTESQTIIDYVAANYVDAYAEAVIGYTPEEVKANPGLQSVLGMALWGFGDMVCKEDVADDEDCPEEAGLVFEAPSGKQWDVEADDYPTAEDYYAEIYEAYGGDVAKAWEVENATGNADVKSAVATAFIKEWGPKDQETGGEGVPNISGIKKTGDYSIEVVLNEFEAPAIYAILGISITPMHYYGDKAQYDYENNKFGFPYGDLTTQTEKLSQPMGAGPYKFVEYNNRIVRFAANTLYYKGSPKIAEIQFKETDSRDVASALNTGDADAGELSFNMERFQEVMGYNSNGETTGDVITLIKVDNLGYGYIGINADTINVAGDPGSEASKNLRKALATIFAVRRDVAIRTYYGEFATVINYPISNTSWAAPQPTDDGYQIAFSVNAEGQPIFTEGMEPDAKYEAARQAALGFLEAAGYTVEGGKATSAPTGAKMAYEIIIPGDGTGDHPAFAILTDAQADFKAIGIELIINDPANSNVLWDALDGGAQEMWTAAWGSTIDPDMYQVYYSANVVGDGGTDSNHYHIRDAELDKHIMDARKSDDQNYRKAVYKQALDVIIDWAVEIPTYQRQNATIFSTKRIVIDTLTPDITTFWGWMNDIELLETVPTP